MIGPGDECANLNRQLRLDRPGGVDSGTQIPTLDFGEADKTGWLRRTPVGRHRPIGGDSRLPRAGRARSSVSRRNRMELAAVVLRLRWCSAREDPPPSAGWHAAPDSLDCADRLAGKNTPLPPVYLLRVVFANRPGCKPAPDGPVAPTTCAPNRCSGGFADSANWVRAREPRTSALPTPLTVRDSRGPVRHVVTRPHRPHLPGGAWAGANLIFSISLTMLSFASM